MQSVRMDALAVAPSRSRGRAHPLPRPPRRLLGCVDRGRGVASPRQAGRWSWPCGRASPWRARCGCNHFTGWPRPCRCGSLPPPRGPGHGRRGSRPALGAGRLSAPRQRLLRPAVASASRASPAISRDLSLGSWAGAFGFKALRVGAAVGPYPARAPMPVGRVVPLHSCPLGLTGPRMASHAHGGGLPVAMAPAPRIVPVVWLCAPTLARRSADVGGLPWRAGASPPSVAWWPALPLPWPTGGSCCMRGGSVSLGRGGARVSPHTLYGRRVVGQRPARGHFGCARAGCLPTHSCSAPLGRALRERRARLLLGRTLSQV